MRPRALAAVAVAVLLLAAFLVFDVGVWLREVMALLQSQRPARGLLFILLHASAVVTLIPGMVFPLAAGLLFGVWPGALYSVIAKVLGSSVAFLLGRHLLRDRPMPERVRRARQNRPLLQVIESELVARGWRAVLLIRLVPMIPFKLSNYVFGASAFRFRDFVLGTLLGVIPYSLSNAYLGSLGQSLATLGSRPSLQQPGQWLVASAGAAVAVAASIALGVLAARLLHRASSAQ